MAAVLAKADSEDACDEILRKELFEAHRLILYVVRYIPSARLKVSCLGT